jgi:hypothetical protein
MIARLLALAVLAALLVLPGARAARADGLTPLLIEIGEIQPGVFTLYWRAPPGIPAVNLPTVEMPKGCTDAAGAAKLGGSSVRKVVRCGDIRGGTVSIRYPQFNPSAPTILRLRLIGGPALSQVLEPSATSWTIPRAESRTEVARDYTLLGFHHILGGADHLLFVACLLWIAGSWRRMLGAITGFTLAHSVSLALSALKLVHVPEAPVEVAIALSILFLAREAAAGRRDTLTWRHPLVVSSAFGLLHGLGFASALMEVGLPQTEVVAGLLFFNVGVELGQIAFVAAVLAVVRGVGLLRIDWPAGLARVPVYGVGALAGFWTLRNAWTAFVGPI